MNKLIVSVFKFSTTATKTARVRKAPLTLVSTFTHC